jgi:hypothetical protein
MAFAMDPGAMRDRVAVLRSGPVAIVVAGDRPALRRPAAKSLKRIWLRYIGSAITVRAVVNRVGSMHPRPRWARPRIGLLLADAGLVSSNELCSARVAKKVLFAFRSHAIVSQ